MPTYTSAALTEPIEILGFPVASLTVEASMPIATIVVRLSDVAPDGTAAQVSAGVLNLTHRDAHDAPSGSRARPAVCGPGRAARGRLPVRAGSPHPAVRREQLLAGPLAVAVPG